MSDPISYDPFLGWVDTTDPDNLPEDVRIIGAADLLRYENFGVAATTKINAESVRVDDAIVRLDDHDDVIAALDTRVDGVDTAVAGLDTRIDGIEGAPSAVKFYKLNSAVTRTATTTLASVSDLTFTLGSYEAVEITAVLFVTSPTTADFKFAFTGSGLAAGRWGLVDDNTSVGWSSPSGSAIGVSTDGTTNMFVAKGYLGAGSAGGPVALQFAQLTSDPGDTILQNFSYLKTHHISGG